MGWLNLCHGRLNVRCCPVWRALLGPAAALHTCGETATRLICPHTLHADCPDLYEFLRAGSQLYELAAPQPRPLQKQPSRRPTRCLLGVDVAETPVVRA